MTLLASRMVLCASVGMTSSSLPRHLYCGHGDSEFAAKAAAGNRAEVALGRLGVERATSADVKQVASVWLTIIHRRSTDRGTWLCMKK